MIRIGNPTLDWVLGLLSFASWTTAYLIYFARDIRVWFWRYRHRRELAAIRRAQGYATYAAYTRAPRHSAWTPPALPVIDVVLPECRNEAPPAKPAEGATNIVRLRPPGQFQGE